MLLWSRAPPCCISGMPAWSDVGALFSGGVCAADGGVDDDGTGMSDAGRSGDGVCAAGGVVAGDD
jgi:hypothetical protein